MSIDIQELPLRPRHLKPFVYFPQKLYKGPLFGGYSDLSYDPHWVPPLWRDEFALFDPRVHPVHHHAQIQPFLAPQNGQIVGRIAAIKDDLYIEAKGRKAGYFVFFECIRDKQVALAL